MKHIIRYARLMLGLVLFGIGFILQTTFRILHFDVKALRHESIFETLHLRRRPRT